MRKATRRFVLYPLLTLVLVVVGLCLSIDYLATVGIERGTSFATGTRTRVDGLSLSLVRGQMGLDRLTIFNPQGFDSAHLLRFDKFNLDLEPASVFGNTVRLTKFELDGVDLHIEQKVVANNVGKVLENLKRFEGKAQRKDPEARRGKRVFVDRIVIRNIAAHFHVLIGEQGRDVTVTVPEITLNNVASDNVKGVVIGELLNRVLPPIFAAAVSRGEGLVPADFLGSLDRDIEDAAHTFGQQAEELLKQSEDDLQKALEKGLDDLLREREPESSEGS